MHQRSLLASLLPVDAKMAPFKKSYSMSMPTPLTTSFIPTNSWELRCARPTADPKFGPCTMPQNTRDAGMRLLPGGSGCLIGGEEWTP